MPRIILKNGGTMMVAVPRAEAGGRFTRSFERRVIELFTQCRTVRGAARLERITEDAVGRVLKRAVARGQECSARNQLRAMDLPFFQHFLFPEGKQPVAGG